MSLNPQKGNMYDFISHTWNPIKGECPHGCEYCYMKRWGQLQPLHYDIKCARDYLGEGKTIFVGSGTDMWAEDVPRHQIIAVLQRCGCYKANTYFFQSKNPARFYQHLEEITFEAIFCTTIETNRYYPQMGRAPSPAVRARAMALLSEQGRRTMVTIEPVMKFDEDILVNYIEQFNPEQINIGADSKRSGLPEPSNKELESLIDRLRKSYRVKLKNNLKRLGDKV